MHELYNMCGQWGQAVAGGSMTRRRILGRKLPAALALKWSGRHASARALLIQLHGEAFISEYHVAECTETVCADC